MAGGKAFVTTSAGRMHPWTSEPADVLLAAPGPSQIVCLPLNHPTISTDKSPLKKGPEEVQSRGADLSGHLVSARTIGDAEVRGLQPGSRVA